MASKPYIRLAKGYATPTATVGGYCVIAKSSGLLTQKQVEAFRWTLRRLKRLAVLKLPIRVFIPCSKKAGEVRMGKGKGGQSIGVFSARRGYVLAEITPVSEGCASIMMFGLISRAARRLPIQVVVRKL